jgi:pimeloyl-ACP methyl ester carboxylesterase
MAVCGRDGASIRYRHIDGDGTPVLFVHGGLHERMDAERFWVAPGVASAVSAAGHPVLLPDRRWMGGATSAPIAVHDWPLEAGDLAAVLRHAGAGPALVVAGSNGCSAALRLALDHAALVAGLVLCWPVPGRALARGRLAAAFERSAAFLAGSGTEAYLRELARDGAPGTLEERVGGAFATALLHDERARASFLELDGERAAEVVRASARALPGGETVRGAADEELRRLGAGGPAIRVVAPASDDADHTRLVAERVAALAGAPRPGPGFPETPRPEFAAARAAFTAELLGLLTSVEPPAGGIRP